MFGLTDGLEHRAESCRTINQESQGVSGRKRKPGQILQGSEFASGWRRGASHGLQGPGKLGREPVQCLFPATVGRHIPIKFPGPKEEKQDQGYFGKQPESENPSYHPLRGPPCHQDINSGQQSGQVDAENQAKTDPLNPWHFEEFPESR